MLNTANVFKANVPKKEWKSKWAKWLNILAVATNAKKQRPRLERKICKYMLIYSVWYKILSEATAIKPNRYKEWDIPEKWAWSVLRRMIPLNKRCGSACRRAQCTSQLSKTALKVWPKSDTACAMPVLHPSCIGQQTKRKKRWEQPVLHRMVKRKNK